MPFKSLRYAAGKGKLWGFNVARNIDRFNDEFDQWLPDDRNISGFLIKHGKITGLDEIKGRKNPGDRAEHHGFGNRQTQADGAASRMRMPTVSIRSLIPFGIQDPGRFVNDPVKQDLGVNVKYTITPNITLDAAINPDFAEIEADAPVVTANQRFPDLFPGKAPVLSRRAGHLQFTAVAFLFAHDRRPGHCRQTDRKDRQKFVRLSGRVRQCAGKLFRG